MKKYILVFTLLFCSVEYAFCQESETRALESFNKILISGNAKVYLTSASPQEVRVETKNKLSEVRTAVNDHTLRIDGKPSSIYITIPELEEVVISGFGELHSASSSYKGESMHIEISGNGKVVLPAEVKSLNVDISGFGKVRLSGSAEDFKLSVSGNATVDAEELHATNMNAEISGVAKASVDVSDNLNMNISGVGSVYYKTEPKTINHNVSGIGKYGAIERSDDDTTTLQLGKKRIVIIGGNEKTVDVDEDRDRDRDIDVDIDMDNFSHPKKPKKSRSHWAGVDLGFNGYFSDGTSTDIPDGYNFLELKSGQSLALGINIWKWDLSLYHRYVMLTTGIGLTFNNYRFRSDKTLLADTNLVVAAYDYKETGELIAYNKNKLAVSYITVPVLLQFNTHSRLKKSFHVAAGLTFSYKYGSHLKLVYDDNGDKQKTKRKDEFNIEPFRYDATVRIGFRNYTLFGSYAMSELFKNGRGPTLHPFTAGIQLAGW
jgi:hypothetical protein